MSMTIDEAIQDFRQLEYEFEHYMCDTEDKKENLMKYQREWECYKQLAEWLEEIQHYRAIGTVEEIKALSSMEIHNFNALQKYRTIGTIEEFKALKEKAEPKKVALRLCGDCQRGCVACDRYEDKCPTCNGGLYSSYVESGKNHEYCPNCGQKLDWSE